MTSQAAQIAETGETQMTEARPTHVTDDARQWAAAGPEGTNRNLADEGGEDAGTTTAATRIAGISVLKGLVLYGATLTFAGFVRIFHSEDRRCGSRQPTALE